MGKPSMFSRDYQRIMKRRKTIFRISIVIAAFLVVILIYSRSAIPNLKRFVENIRTSPKISSQEIQKNNPEKDDNKNGGTNENTGSAGKKETNTAQKPVQNSSGEYQFKFPNGDAIAITYDKNGSDIRITGIKQSNTGISFDIRNDKKAIVFDNPRTSDIWILDASGAYKKLSADSYKQVGNEGIVFNKDEVMKQYNNNYIWASKPKFLTDGRIVYQSYMPWFKAANNYYIWVVDNNGQNNRMVIGTDQEQPVKYQGFLDDGSLIVEYNGTRYAINVDSRSKRAVN